LSADSSKHAAVALSDFILVEAGCVLGCIFVCFGGQFGMMSALLVLMRLRARGLAGAASRDTCALARDFFRLSPYFFCWYVGNRTLGPALCVQRS